MPDQPITNSSPATHDGGRACTHWNGTRHCGRTDSVRLYNTGPRCPACTPAALAGRPEPSGQSCAPLRHYCLATDTPCPDAPVAAEHEPRDEQLETEAA